MRISEHKLRLRVRRVLREFWDQDVERFLTANAAEYHKDPSLDAGSVRMLLMDDFMDHVGHSEDPADYEDLINKLAAGDDLVFERSLQELGKGWQLSDGSCNTHNITRYEAGGAIAVLQEFGYSLSLPPSVDSNTYAINDALAAYPGEYSYEDFLCAIRVTQGRGA